MKGTTMNVDVHVGQDLLHSLPAVVKETLAPELLLPAEPKFTAANLWKIERKRRKATPARRKIDPIV